jgi:hypothetical protein
VPDTIILETPKRHFRMPRRTELIQQAVEIVRRFGEGKAVFAAGPTAERIEDQ